MDRKDPVRVRAKLCAAQAGQEASLASPARLSESHYRASRSLPHARHDSPSSVHRRALQSSRFVALFLRRLTDVDTWELDDLAIELELTDTTIVKNSLYFWNNQGVIKNVEGEIWKLLEERDLTQDVVVAHGQSFRALEDELMMGLVIEEEQSAVQSVEAQQVEQVRLVLARPAPADPSCNR